MRAVYLFITTYEQKKENVTTIIDSGCSMTNAIEALEELRTCLESVWPYDISNVNKRPNEEAYDQAKDHQITSALKVNIDLIEMKTCLTQGFPFAFGLRLHKSFDKAAKRGVVPMPDENEQGRNEHGRCDFNYDKHKIQISGFLICRHAMLYIPYDYMTNSAYYFDVWTVRKLEHDGMGHENWDDDENTSSSSSSSAAD